MIYGRLYGADDQTCRIAKVAKTTCFIDRMRGLLGTSALDPGEALLIHPCSSVHTFGMRYKIDLAFLDRNWTIIKTVRALSPWRMAACPSACMVLETADGGLEASRLTDGTRLEWRTD